MMGQRHSGGYYYAALIDSINALQIMQARFPHHGTSHSKNYPPLRPAATLSWLLRVARMQDRTSSRRYEHARRINYAPIHGMPAWPSIGGKDVPRGIR